MRASPVRVLAMSL